VNKVSAKPVKKMTACRKMTFLIDSTHPFIPFATGAQRSPFERKTQTFLDQAKDHNVTYAL
jgi:hypothetical protein